MINHPAWIEALEGDKVLLKNYADIFFNVLKKPEAMGFYVRQNTKDDELRALYIDGLDKYSNANGYDNLYDYARFLLVAQK